MQNFVLAFIQKYLVFRSFIRNFAPVFVFLVANYKKIRIKK